MISPIFHASRKLKLGGGGGEVCILDVVCMCRGTDGAGGGGGGGTILAALLGLLGWPLI